MTLVVLTGPLNFKPTNQSFVAASGRLCILIVALIYIIAWKAVPHVINSRALTGEKPCINKAIHALLMHGYATFNMSVPGPQI